MTETVSVKLRDWYQVHKRDLPWRESSDPYVIWISEIILQQTRVAQGLSYFLRFAERFPDIRSLAEAEEDDVLKYWQGLGYYSRVRNMHTTAQLIMNKFGGIFPEQYEDILSLKGVGEYTAAAITSFVWNKPYPVVDGNVFRVLSRLYGIDTPIDSGKGKREFYELAGAIMDKQYAGIHNQAMMEFGALQCIPQNPDCKGCVLKEQCVAYASGTVSRLPVKKSGIKTRNRYFHYFHVTYEQHTFLSKRGEKDIWAGLYEFPLIETDELMDFAELEQASGFRDLFEGCGNLNIKIQLPKVKHVLSHQVLYVSFYSVEIEKIGHRLQQYQMIPCEEIERYAVSRLMHIYINRSSE